MRELCLGNTWVNKILFYARLEYNMLNFRKNPSAPKKLWSRWMMLFPANFRIFVKIYQMAATAVGIAKHKTRSRKVPDYLVKEVIDGIPVYYKGYRDVLEKKKTPEEIRADGLLQAMLKMWLSNLLYNRLDNALYWVFGGEVGTHISHQNNMAHDVAVFEKKVLPPAKITTKYADVPARLVIEIDTEIEYGHDLSPETYVHRKTQNILDFGMQKVIWIFPASRKVMTAEAGQHWFICDWNEPVELLDGVTANVAGYLEGEGVYLSPSKAKRNPQ